VNRPEPLHHGPRLFLVDLDHAEQMDQIDREHERGDVWPPSNVLHFPARLRLVTTDDIPVDAPGFPDVA
jgi:hypothetical protein